MVLVRVAGGKHGRIFSKLGLRLLLVAASLSLVSGQQAGVTLSLRGVTIPNGSFVDFDDVMYTGPTGQSDLPSNRNTRDEALKCVTDLEDCCGRESDTPSGIMPTVLGDWYTPSGAKVGLGGGAAWQANRGPNEMLANGTQVYGSVRLYRRYTPPERGHFRCELPSAANPSVNQILYANILNFGFTHTIDPVTITPSAPSTAGRTDYSLTCSSTLFDPSRLPSDVPSPNFQWSFNGNTSLPSGVTAMPTVLSSSNSTSATYTSTLQFSPLSQSLHTGMYTCRLGAASLVNSAMVTVNAPVISVQITTSGAPSLGQSDYSLTCGVAGAENLPITYKWTKNGAQTVIRTDEILSFASLGFSDAGLYTCQATISSSYLNNDITMMDTQDITIQIPAPTAVVLSSDTPNPILPFGSGVVTLTCNVELSPAVNVPVTVNTQFTTPAGFSTTIPAQLVTESMTNYTSTSTVSSFRRANSGLYTCGATVRSASNAYISDSRTVSHMVRVTTGVYLALRGVHIANNSNINTRNIGQSPEGALQCITDKNRCCLTDPGGKWYLPNRALVQGTFSTTAFYRSRGDNGEVSLNRPGNVISPTGLFCCEVPDDTNTNQILCVNIGLSITVTGSPTAGEDYTLECSAGGSEGTFQWLKGSPDSGIPVDENSPRLSILSASTSSRLQFRPVQQSDNGSYFCNATINGSTLHSDPMSVSINAPTVSINISDGGATPMAGLNHQLTCSVSGAEKLRPITTYRWTMNSNSDQIQVGDNSSILSFTPLQLSDAASYVCEVTISSNYLTGDIVAKITNPQDVRIEIPPLASLMLTSSPDNSDNNIIMVAVEESVMLTCTLVLNSAIDVSEVSSLLMVSTQLTHPNGTMLSLLNTTSGTTITYMYTTQLNSFGRSDSGNYTCNATVGAQPSAATYLTGIRSSSGKLEVTTGVYLSFNVSLYANNYVVIADIGERAVGGTGGPLLCYTDNMQCCNSTNNIMGDWYLPGEGRMKVGDESSGGNFYVTRGPGVVLLHRRNDATSPIGMFCCEVPDARSVSRETCIDIVLFPPTTPIVTTRGSVTGAEIRTPNTIPAIAGGVVAGLAVLLILVAIIIVVLVFLRRRSSSKPYEVSKTKSSVHYSKQKNGDQVLGVGINKEPKIVDFPSDTNITEGEGVYFRIKVSGEPQPTVTWYHDGEPVRADYAREIESDGSLAIPSAELKHSGVYKAVAENRHGSEQRELKLTVSEEGAETTVDIGERVKSRPIPIPEFGKYVSELHSNSNKPFKDLYESLDTGEQGHSTGYATDPYRKPLNRFGNIIVYDDNRIVLQPLAESKDCQGDYINACYMDGYSVPNKFIATQGPIPKTVVDFWRLIWQEHPPTIVMVTNIKEGSKIKCQQYWPNSGQESYGPFNVVITDQQVYADYTVRTLSVSLGSGGRSHKVTQYHFTAWPDHGVPDYATPILAFHRRVKAQHHPSRGPMVVHCSAGVGRTGTFIVIDNILEQIEKEQVVDIPGAITKIRQKRMKMVQTHDQFTFIHDAILESVTCGDTQISATNLRSTIMKLGKKAGFQHQMKVLEQVSPNPDEVQCNAARNHPDRNRGDKYLPADRWRVILKGEQPDYIHAVSINGYKHQRAFIIAQGPLQSTVRNFWKMIYDRKSAVIVMVSDLMEGGQEACAQYWPNSGIAEYGQYTVDLLGEEPLQGFTIRSLSVLDKKTQKAHQVTQFHITCWKPDGHCSNLKSVTDVIEEMTKVQIRSGNKPIVVHCSDTVTRSGMFCAVATTIERCKTEGVVDVFQVVKALRVQKPGAVPTVEQYQQLFETVLVFLESFDTYANFQM